MKSKHRGHHFFELAVSIIIVFNSTQSFAIDGLILDPTQNPESLCKIEFKENGELGSCSGVLISPNQVMTAEHCLISDSSNIFVPLQKYRVECGNKKFKIESSLKSESNGQLIHRLMSLKPNGLELQNQAAASDIAILTLKKNSKTPYMKRLSGVETRLKFFENGSLRDGVECRFAGYATGAKAAAFEIGGKSDYQLKSIPDFEGMLIHQPAAFPTDQEEFAVNNGTIAAKAYVQEGDSGGPVYCKSRTDDHWNLIGVLSMGKLGFAGSTSFSIIKVSALWGSVLE